MAKSPPPSEKLRKPNARFFAPRATRCPRRVFATTATGVSIVEVAIAAVLMTAITAMALDATIFTMAYARIDSTTRDAARAAANQQTSAQALRAAQTQLATHSTDGVFIRQPVLTGIAAPYFVYQDYGGNVPPGPPYVSPYVSVCCSEDVYLPVPIGFMGTTFQGFLVSGNHLTLSKQYVFPIVKMKYY